MNSQKLYSLISQNSSLYDFLSFITGYKKSINYFIDQLPFPKDMPLKVLDAGAGIGPYTFSLLQKYPNATITAFDTDIKSIDFVRAQAKKLGFEDRVNVFVSDITGPLTELTHQSFDLIITAGVLVYVPHEATIKNLSRFLASGGYFFNSPNRDSLWGRFICLLYKCKPYTSTENIEAFEKNGFTLVNNILVPKTPSASFKDAHLFKKI